VRIDDELRGLLEQLSAALKESVRGSDRIHELLREIESRGYTPSLTFGVVLGHGASGERSDEIQETLLGPLVPERPVSIRRLSAFDRKFLRALRIQMPS
jgi:hypothetical protein